MDIRLEPKESALMVVDVQEKLLAVMAAPQRERVLQHCINLTLAARSLSLPILVTEQYPKGLGATVAPLKEALGETYQPVAKDAFSALAVPGMQERLNDLGRRRVVVVGMEAHICVLMTSRDLVQHGFLTHVPHDGCVSRRPEDHLAALELMRQAGVCVTTAETVQFDWLGSAAHPQFREVSRRLK